jgi:hypothetical protein
VSQRVRIPLHCRLNVLASARALLRDPSASTIGKVLDALVIGEAGVVGRVGTSSSPVGEIGFPEPDGVTSTR